MRRALLALLAGVVLVLTGCSAPGAPEVTFFADGHTINARPLVHCDVVVSNCQRNQDAEATLKVRAGKPVQVSVPSEITDTPWVVNVQYLNAKGEPQPVKQQFFAPGARHAYTATGSAPGDQLLVVEIQQISAATSVDKAGAPILDEAGNPQLVVRAIWSLQIQPA